MLRVLKWLTVGLVAAVPIIKWLIDSGFFNDWSWRDMGFACFGIFLVVTILANLGYLGAKWVANLGVSFLASFVWPVLASLGRIAVRFFNKTFGTRRRY